MQTSFEFICDGVRLVGTLFQAANEPVAAIVTTGPLTSVKEQATGAYAKALAERGFAALAFDIATSVKAAARRGSSRTRPRRSRTSARRSRH